MKTILGLFALFSLLTLTARSQVAGGGAPPPGFSGSGNPVANPNFQPPPPNPAFPQPAGLPPRPRPGRPPGFQPDMDEPPVGVVAVGKPTSGSPKRERTYSSLDAPDPATDKETFPAYSIRLERVDLPQVFKIYEDLSGRTMIASPALPPAKVSLHLKTALLRREVLQALDTVLAQYQITVIPMGTDFVKAVPMAQAATEAGPAVDLSPDQLPRSDSYLTYIVRLKHASPREMAPALAPLARMPGSSIMVVENSGLLVLRDYSNNVRHMLQLLEKIDVPSGLPGSSREK